MIAASATFLSSKEVAVTKATSDFVSATPAFSSHSMVAADVVVPASPAYSMRPIAFAILSSPKGKLASTS
jgi:hypothetical protein